MKLSAWMAAVMMFGTIAAGDSTMNNIFTDIPYADGHMGRRQLVDEKHLLVMQVALKPGQKVPQHDANSNVHLLVIEGQVVVTLSGKDITAPAGTLVPVAFQTPMSIRNDSDANASFLILKTPNPSEMASQEPVIREDQAAPHCARKTM